jgi:hypothetical protein
MFVLDQEQKDTLLRYARDTWASLSALTDPDSGLPADQLYSDGSVSVETSISDIGAYLWSVLVAGRLGLISRAASIARLERALGTLAALERHWPSGQFYNWYDHHTGAKWLGGTHVISSVDNAWLATALHVVATSVPALADSAAGLFDSMDFRCYYHSGLRQLAVCYLPEDPERTRHYDAIVSESRMATYIGIATGQLPPEAYFGPHRTFPADYERIHPKAAPVGSNRTYLGVEVFEGTYQYAGMRVVPSFGGSMFEALMPALFVPEERWGHHSWGVNHHLTVAAQIHHGLVEASYGHWGFSPCATPQGGYNAYGVAGIGMSPDGYPSVGVVTPHASFLALRWSPQAVLDNLAALECHFPIYDRWGFRDSVDVRIGLVAGVYLALDQGIIMAAIGNALRSDMLRHAFATPGFRAALRPIIALERFNAAPADQDARLADPGHLDPPI